MNLNQSAAPEVRLASILAPRQIAGLRLLAKSLPELRSEIAAEMARNPAIDSVDTPLETHLSEVQRNVEDGAGEPDYPEDDFTPGLNRDEEAAERRQAIFDRQVKTETLQEHLLAQLPLSDIPQGDWPLVEVLIGDLDGKGYYKGSVPDAAMAFGCDEAHVLDILSTIRAFDPPGCGARDARECLLAQLDAISDPVCRLHVRQIVDAHLEDVAAGRLAEIRKALNLGEADLAEALVALRSLDGRPGRQYPSEHERIEYVNPEIHAVFRNGRWMAETDARSLPEIRLSKTFADLLKDPNQSDETKAYVRERIAAAQAFREAIAHRQSTVAAIAQAIFDRQPEFFSHGSAALRPMTEEEIARAVKVHETTVSRTVRDKYAETPKGTMELRRFFVAGVKVAGGETVSQARILDTLKRLVAEEDATAPLSDERLAARLAEVGFPIARRTVAKYRDRLGIPGASERRHARG